MHFDESLFTCQCEKENEQAEDRRVSNFTLLVLLVVFKWHHCSEGVKTHFFGWKSWSIVYAYKTQSSPQEERLWGIIPSFIIVIVGVSAQTAISYHWQCCDWTESNTGFQQKVQHEWKEPKNGWYLKQTKRCCVAEFTTVLFLASMNEENRKMDGTWKKQKVVLLFSSPQFCFLFACFFCLFGGFLYLWYHHGASHFAPHRCFTCQISDKGLF